MKIEDLDNIVEYINKRAKRTKVIDNGLFIKATDYNKEDLSNLVSNILDRLEIDFEVLWFNGADEGLWPLFHHILKGYSSLDKPQLFVIENFDKLESRNDQYNISRLLSDELNGGRANHPASVFLISTQKTSRLNVKPGFASWIDLDR